MQSWTKYLNWVQQYIKKIIYCRSLFIILYIVVCYFFSDFFIFLLFKAAPSVCGSPQARGWITATTASLYHSHSQCRWPKPHLTATPVPWPIEWGQASNLHPHGYYLDLFLFCHKGNSQILFFFILFIYLFFGLFRAAPVAYGGSQARGRTGAVPTGPSHSHSSDISEPHLWPTPQLTATPDP